MANGQSGHPRNLTAPRENMENRNTITSDRRGNWRNMTEPHGAPIEGHYAIRSTFRRTLGTAGPLVFPVPPPPQIPNVSAVSKRLVLVGWSNIGAMRRIMGIWAQRSAAEPHGT